MTVDGDGGTSGGGTDKGGGSGGSSSSSGKDHGTNKRSGKAGALAGTGGCQCSPYGSRCRHSPRQAPASSPTAPAARRSKKTPPMRSILISLASS